MERAAGFVHEDTVQAKQDKLDALLAQSLTTRQDAALLAEMLSLPNDKRPPALELTAQQRRQKTLEALTTQLEALSRSNPDLMIFEDVHWVDPTSLEVLGRTVDRLKSLKVLLTVTSRPEFEPPWVGRPKAKVLKLADKTSNLHALATSSAPDWSVRRKMEYISWARKVVAGLRGTNEILEKQFDEAAQAAEQSLVPTL